jgi:hypothetical protein
MKHYILFFLLAFSTISGNSQNAETDLIIGKWYNYDKTEIIEITKSKNTFIGHILWMKKPNDKNGKPKLDGKNPTKKLQNQTILGSQNIFDLQYKNGKWENGKMYSYKKSGTADFKVIFLSKTKLVIKISIGFFSKEIIYTKAT